MATDQSSKQNYDAARSLENRVWELVAQNKARQAVAACEQLNQHHPAFASGWHTASQLAMKLNNRPLALTAIDKALAIDSHNTVWLLQKALCLLKLERTDQLAALIDKLSRREFETAYQCSTFGMLLTQMGRSDEAVAPYEKASVLQPGEAKHYYNLACLQHSLGHLDAAELNFEKTISLDPGSFEVYKIRSDLRKQTPGNNHVAALVQLLDKGIDDTRGTVHVCFALAKELEDLNEPARSFHYLKTGADLRRGHMQYEVRRDLETMAAIRDAFNATLFDTATDGHDNPEALFVLGMPRTGTTLVERILASHTDVYAAGELNNFAIQMMRLVRPLVADKKVDRDVMVKLSTTLDFKKLGEAYIDSTRPLTGHTARFIDKMPLNFLYLGLIHLALPNARIVSLRRHPLDTCYAIYKQLFVDAYPFSYNLEDLGQYYVAYYQLMEHWHAVLPGVIHTVEYEKLVDNMEAESRQLLKFCGLDWQAQCLRFHENKEASTTASTVQVRQPVYRSSVGKWQRYREQLAPLIKVLQDAGIPLDD